MYNKIINVVSIILKYIFLFIIGGCAYILVELLFRGYSHWTMFFLGGLCFVYIGGINNWFDWEMRLIKQMLISSIIITILEFITGYIVNIILKWNVWDYSDMPLNFMGQICLPFTFIWFFISLLAIVLDDYVRYWWFKEEKPHYKLL